MTPSAVPLRSIIAAARQTVRRDALIATVLAAFMVVPAVLLVTWVIGFTGRIGGRLPLALDALAIAAAAGIVFLALKRWIARITHRTIAASAEARFGLSEGQLQSVLEMNETAPPGTSTALLRRSERELAVTLANHTPGAVAGVLGHHARMRRVRLAVVGGTLCVLVTLLAFVAPERSRASWSPLLRPVATLAGSALPPLRVQPGTVSVPRGTDVSVQISAPQRDGVTLFWRARGDVLNEEVLAVLATGATARIEKIDAPVRYWVRAPDGAVSDTFTITPLDPLMVSALSIDVLYPAYLNRAPEHFEKDVPPLELPHGTELRIRGRSTRPVRAVALERSGEAVPLDVKGTAFAGSFRPRQSGVYMWKLSSSAELDAAAAPPPLEITVIADTPPEIEMTYPGADTLLPADMKQLLVADARDDYGITSAVLVSWRSSLTGREAQVEEPLTLEGEADRSLVRGVLDATTRRLLPGDTLHYFVRVTDNSPARQSAVTRTYTLRVPGMDEMREYAQAQAEELVRDADAVARAMKQLESRTRDLQRKSVAGGARAGQRGAGGAPGANEKQLSSEQAEQARQVLERQEELAQEMQKLRDRMETLQRAAEQAGLRDPEMQKRLEELKELYDQVLSPELKKQLDDLRRALEEHDPDAVQKALEQLANQQQELREKLDQSLELMRRAAAEQEMSKLAQEAKELSTQQEALADQMKTGETSPQQMTEQEKDLSEKTNELGSSLLKLQRKLSEQGETDAASQTGKAQQQTREAEEAMSQAAREAARNQPQQAGESGQQAADKLAEAARMLDDARKQMSASWKKEVQETVDNATQDAINLAQKQQELLERMQASAQVGNNDQNKQGGQQQPNPGQQGQQDGNQQGASRENGKQEGGQGGQGGQGQKPGGEQGSNAASGGQPGASQGQLQQIRAEQAALKQGLEQLGRNLTEAGQRSAMVNRDVSSALARANLNMEQTIRALENATQETMPKEQAEQTLNALNRLALELLKNGQQIDQSESGTGLQQALEQLAELAKQQGNLGGRSNSLLPLNLGPQVMAQQLGSLAREQRDIAQKLGGMNKGGGRDDLLGRLDDLVREADHIARDLEGGRLTPETVRRQSELFHKLLDAGRTIERNEVSEERRAEAALALPPAVIRALRPGLFDDSDRFAVPSAEQMRDLPPAYRRLIVEYFQKLNGTPTRGAEARGR